LKFESNILTFINHFAVNSIVWTTITITLQPHLLMHWILMLWVACGRFVLILLFCRFGFFFASLFFQLYLTRVLYCVTYDQSQ
jgi:hypothetical protein